MSRIIFCETYLILIPSYSKTDVHKHPFLHLFFSEQGGKITVEGNEIQSEIILLNSNVSHVLKENNNWSFFLLIDPTSAIAKKIVDKYLDNNSYRTISKFNNFISNKLNSLSDLEITKIVEKVMNELGISENHFFNRDKRIETVIFQINSGNWLKYSVKKIAASIYLSESRLTHLFKEEVGISLKSYILIRRMEYAYRLIINGERITLSAMKSGFASSAHLAYTCKTLTGVSITEVLRASLKTQK